MKKHLLPNEIDALKWGLYNFDGIEFDVRIAVDGVPVIHHDPVTTNGKIIEKTPSAQLAKKGIPLLHEVLSDEFILQCLRGEIPEKTFWIEIKTPCKKKDNRFAADPETFAEIITNQLSAMRPKLDTVRIIGFNKSYLHVFSTTTPFKAYPILPTINECVSEKMMVIRALPGFLRHSLLWHAKEAKKLGFKGLLFSQLYVKGVLSLRHVKYKNLLKLQSNQFELGVDTKTLQDEQTFRMIHRFTDLTTPHPRHAMNGEGKIIAHRGVGIKGTTLSQKEWQSFQERMNELS